MNKFFTILWMLAIVYTTAARGQDAPVAQAAPTETPQPTVQATPQPAQAAPQSRDLRVVVDLADGSRIVGRPAEDRLKLTTDYAAMDVELALVGTIDFDADGKGAVQVKLRNGDLLKGRLTAMTLGVKTSFGDVTLTLAGMHEIRVSAGGAPGVMPEGLVLHYTFDAAEEGGKVTDASDAGNNGMVKGATFTGDGKVGGAMSFSGDHQAVVVKNAKSLQLQDFTIVAWIKRGDKRHITMSGPGGYAMIFGFGQGGYGLSIVAAAHLTLGKVGISNDATKFAIHDDAWHHVSVTKSGTKVVFYLDGVAYPADDYNPASDPTDPKAPGFEFTTDAAVGARGDDQGNGFIGLIDEVMVFKRALSGDEVKGVFDSQK